MIKNMFTRTIDQAINRSSNIRGVKTVKKKSRGSKKEGFKETLRKNIQKHITPIVISLFIIVFLSVLIVLSI